MQEFVTSFNANIGAVKCHMIPPKAAPMQSETANKLAPISHVSCFKPFTIKQGVMPPLSTKKASSLLGMRAIPFIIGILILIGALL